jgi:hypothetical protein
MSVFEQTHVDEDGLFIPPALREFKQQVVFRTPRSTIQHFGQSPLDAYYGLIDESHFGDGVRDSKNPHLAPNQVSIKLQGESEVTLAVDVEGGVVDAE